MGYLDKPKRSRPRYWVEKSGNLYARLQYTDEIGKKREKYRRISEKREARSTVEKMRREVELHGSETLRSDRMTFADLADQYEKVRLTPAVYSNGIKVAGKRSIGPVKSILKTLRLHFGKKYIRLIKTSDVEAFKNIRLASPVITMMNQVNVVIDPKTNKKVVTKTKIKRITGRNISSINRELQTLRAMFYFAIENDWLIKNPFQKKKGIISVAAEIERDRVLTYEEERRLLAACTGRRSHLRPILICALDTGMRRGELLQMAWKDVDFENGQIYIPQSNTKTETARTVGITSRLRAELEELKISSASNPNGKIFGISDNVKNAWKAALSEAGINDFRLHDCRHTATTRMIASGSPHTEVMKITGHSQIVTFLRYLNVTDETASGVANRLDNYLEDRQRIDECPVSDLLN